MTRNTIDKLLDKTRQQEAQIERQADTITALRRKLEQRERANRALEAREQALLARIAKITKMPAQDPSQRPAEAFAAEGDAG